MERGGAKERKSIDVSEMYFARKQEEGPKEQEKENGTREIRIIHDVLIDVRKGIQHR